MKKETRRCLKSVLLSAGYWQDRLEYFSLRDWWRQGRQSVCILEGVGGAGKTAIVERFLRSLPEALPQQAGDKTLPQPDGVFVFSFDEAAASTTQFFASLLGWLSEEYCDFKGSRQVPRGNSAFESLRQLLEGLAPTNRRRLIIIDGFEHAQTTEARNDSQLRWIKDGDLRDLLLWLAGGYLAGIQAIVTTRYAIPELLRSPQLSCGRIPVESISEEAGLALLKEHRVESTEDRLRILVRECGGHALMVDLAGSYIANFFAGRLEEVPGLLERMQDTTRTGTKLSSLPVSQLAERFEQIVAWYRQGLTERHPPALAVLERICLFRKGVSERTLVSIFSGKARKSASGVGLAALSRKELHRALGVLEDYRLLGMRPRVRTDPQGRSSHVLTAHPLILEGFLKHGDKEQMQMARQAIVSFLERKLGVTLKRLASSKKFDDTCWAVKRRYGFKCLNELEEVLHQALQLGRWQDAFAVYKRGMGAFPGLANGAIDYFRGATLTEMLSAFYRQQPSREWPAEMCRVINDAAGFSRQLGDLMSAEAHYRTAFKVSVKLPQDEAEDRWIAQRNLVNLHLLRGQLRQVCESAKRLFVDTKTLPEGDRRRLDSDLVAYTNLAYTCFLRGSVGEGMALFGKAKHLESQLKSKEPRFLAFPSIWFAMSLIRRRKGSDLQLANEELQRIKNTGKKRGWARIGRWASLVESRLKLAQEDLAAAGRELKRYEDFASGAQEMVASLLSGITLAQIASLKRDVPDRVLDRVGIALSQARSAGYGIYHIDLLIERARLHILRGAPQPALDDLTIALDTGIHPTRKSGLPVLLAATDPECWYAWAIAEGRHLRAQALLLQAAQRLGRSDSSSTTFKALPAQVRRWISSARTELEKCRALRKSIQDPRVHETEKLLKDLNRGVQMRPPLASADGRPVGAPQTITSRTRSHDRPRTKQWPKGNAMIRTVVELDLVAYSSIAEPYQQGLGAKTILQLNQQIQAFIDEGLRAVKARREDCVMETTGDGAILFFEHPTDIHVFSEAVHAATHEHNRTRSDPMAKRVFRIGAATGEVVMEPKPGGGFNIAGTTIAHAVRLEAKATPGGLLVDAATFEGLAGAQRQRYGPKRSVAGKRGEVFEAYGCVFSQEGAKDASGLADQTASAEPAANAMRGFGRDQRRDVLTRFKSLKSHQYTELIFLLEIPIGQRPADSLNLDDRKGRILNWAEEDEKLDDLLDVLRELTEPTDGHP
ncbi:MAG: hypothetical protein HY735_17975 [Verrucomicrobia bacterium]|nr:hypothetical protein [Verrucomicrobiota bacterium]